MQTLRILLIRCCLEFVVSYLSSGGCIFCASRASQADIRLQVQNSSRQRQKVEFKYIYIDIYMYISRNSLDRRRFLRSIASLAASEQHRERLLELCDEDGALEDYTKGGRATVGGVFTDFDSVRPGLSQLISIMPRLRPRPYSSMPQIPGEMPDSGLLPRCFYI